MATPMEEDLPAAPAAAPADVAGGDGDGDGDGENPAPAAPPSDSDSDSSDSNDGGGGADELRIQALERVLREQPLDYESHVQYIQCLWKSGKIEKLRAAREEMNKYFPLTPKMWQEWAKDETSLSTGHESFGDIEMLYERGVQEYLSIRLWRDYLDYVEEHDQSVSQCAPAGLKKMRNLFERAITAGGLHVTDGSKLWEAYREYELAILTVFDGDDEEKTKQVQRIRVLFHRQLSVPLADMESTLAEYKSWEAEQGNANDPGSDFDGVSPNVVSAYKKANEMYISRKQYEDQLTNVDASEADKLQEFLKYIKFEESSGDPARVQILYERAVSELPVSSDLWMGYTSYLDRTLKVPAVLKSVYHRATRNCTWVSELWLHYLLSLERIHSSEEELRHVFEQALQCSFPSIKEYLDIYLTRVDSLRRRMPDGLNFQLIRQTFMDASEFLSPQLGTKELLLFYAYWAKLERNLGKDLAAARGVWENALKKSGSVLEVWQHYIAMEIEMGHVHEARSLYKRCYSKRFAGSGSEDICHAWIRFEREHGTLDDYDTAIKKIIPMADGFYTSLLSGDIVEQTWEENQDSSPIGEQAWPPEEHVASFRPSNKRSKNWSQQEDELLVQAWLNTSLDAAIGTEQTKDSYWTRIHQYFHTNKQFDSVRNQNSISNRWGTIQEQVNKFCGCYDQIQNRRQSGMTAQDRIVQACTLFQAEDTKGRSFGLLHCWRVLEHHPKWTSRLSQKKQKTSFNATPNTSSLGTTSNDEAYTPEHPPLRRPTGKKAEKERLRRGKNVASSDSSTVMLALDSLWSKKLERDVQKEANKAARYERALAIEEKMMALEESKQTIEKEKMAIEQQKLEIQRKSDEERIMSMDTNAMTG